MIKPFKINFTFSLFLLLLNSLAFSQPQTRQCETRLNFNDCYDKPKQYVCGYYTNNCPLEICGEISSNGCQACSNPDVQYYEVGFCDPDIEVHTCSEGFCNRDADLPSYESFEPVCGLKRNQDGGLTERTFDTVCQLCQESDFQYYSFRPCKEDRVYCQNSVVESDPPQETEVVEVETESPRSGSGLGSGPRPGPNPRPSPKDDSVCAVFKAKDMRNAYVNVSSGSEACADKGVEFYTIGACGPLRDDAEYCLPNNRPEVCNLDFSPVCGFYKDAEGFIDSKVMSNGCVACAAPEIIYYVPGSCISSCDDEAEDDDCEGKLEPVCGTYEAEGGQRSVSLSNSCVHCHPSGKPILEFESGLCSREEGIRCEDDPGTKLEGYLNPVCGYRTEHCEDGSCRRTYAEPSLACGDESSIWYSPGPCPEDEGVSCTDYRTRPSDSNDVYEDVCGYTTDFCLDDSCREHYNDQYAACEDESVLYFIKGSCV